MNKKSIIAVISLIISVTGLAVALLAVLQIMFLVVGDLSAGAFTGTPETGWGILFALFIGAPILGVALAVHIAGWVLYKKFSSRPFRALWLWPAAIILASCIFGMMNLYESSRNPPKNSSDEVVALAIRTHIDEIDDKFYEKGHVLPAINELPDLANQGLIYSIMNETTYKICGKFEVNTIPYYYDEEHPDAGGGVAKKVMNGSTLGSADAMSVSAIHNQGNQCYTIELYKPES